MNYLHTLSAFTDFFTAVPWYILLAIFVAKNIEVTVGTLRVILITRGYRLIGSMLALVEIFIWVFVAGNVLTGLTQTPIKAVVYGLAFTTGVFLGSLVEGKLAFGTILIETITSEEYGPIIAARLREIGHGVTTLVGYGKEKPKIIVKVIAKRRLFADVNNEILKIDPRAVIVKADVSELTGGYLLRARSPFK